MIRLSWILALFLSVSAWADPNPPVAFQLDSVPVSQVLRVMYSEALKTPYVIEPSALKDERLVSFRWDSARGDVRTFLDRFLGAMGYQVESVGGVDFVRAKQEGEKSEPDKQLFVYRPKYCVFRAIVTGDFAIA